MTIWSDGIVYTVYRIDDESTHIFSTPDRAKQFAESIDSAVVHSTYMIDYPERYYGATQ